MPHCVFSCRCCLIYDAVVLLLCRVQQETFRVAEMTSELQTQRRRNAQLEKQLGKAKIEQIPSGELESPTYADG